MNARPSVLLALVALLCCVYPMRAQFPAACDTRKDCIFNAVQSTVTSGRNAHFVEVQSSPTRAQQTALTVEMWVKIERQSGKRQFLGGLWGPLEDYNDQWLLSIDAQDQLTFEINGDVTRQGRNDNTIARAPFSAHYDKWTHVAGVFDGASRSVTLYINGQSVAGPVTNAQYPATYLKGLERNDLTTQIGSCNALADDQNLYRTLKGWVDEVRIWSRALSAGDVLCQKDRSLNGNEPGLELYFRCNEPVNNILQLCDATGKGRVGLLRSGATNQRSDRVAPRNVVVTPTQVTDTLRCDTVRQWTFRIQDTSVCGSTVNLRVRGPEARQFSVSQASANLVPGQPVDVTVTYTGSNIGSFLDTFEIRPTDRCGLPVTFIKLTLTRLTELSYSRNFIRFDTLWVGCTQKTSVDSTITICNTSDMIGTPRTVTITNILANEPLSYRVMNVTFPMTLAPGQCTTLTVRSFVRDTTADYLDTLRVISDDRCQRGPGLIAIAGRTQEVISIRTPDGSRRIDTIRFNATCPGTLSSPVYYTWQNLTLTPLSVDTIVVPPDFTHYRVRFPNILQPATGYQPIAIRFRPRNPGNVFDSIIIRTKIQGCDIERKIYVRGRGYDNKVEWELNGQVDFGDVIVGQQRQLNVRATNRSAIDTLNVALYVEKGDGFALVQTGRRILPGETVNIPVIFRPIDSLTYIDRLCLFETRCYTVDCIELRGRGILETFRFSPLVMETQNVVGCGSELDTVHIVNLTNAAQTITNVAFNNPSTKFAVIEPPLPWTTFTIPARDSLRFVVRYTPADVARDRADRAFINYESAGAVKWQVQLIGTSATPKLFVTPLSSFGTVEVGDRRRLRVAIENTSSMPVTVDSLSIANGFVMMDTSRVIPTTLQPRDSIIVDIDFVPTASQSYSGKITAYSKTPCTIVGSGDLEGRGIIVELENALSLINFGYVRPCECTERMLPLLNASLVHPMTVDSLWIDSLGIPGGKPQFFTWRSVYSPTGALPFTIPPSTRDTVFLRFCPNTPAEANAIDVRANVFVKARGSGWAKTTETFLAGKRALTFRPTPTLVQFPYGVVDVTSPVPLPVTIKIPDFTLNPYQDEVVIDSVTFEPDERVFLITAPVSFPQTIRPGDSLRIDVRQRPRAPRDYEAKMILHYSKPCNGRDTTVLVRGGGFAQPRGLAFAFDLTRFDPDTFLMYSCDTLVVPVYSSITIDASVVDMKMRLDFDTTQLRLLDITSPVIGRSCTSQTGNLNYTPSITLTPSPYGGTDVLCKNFCGVDSLSPFAYARFVTVANNRVNSPITIDSISFDTEDVILYRLVANGERGTIIAQKSEIAIAAPVPFDSVRILECVDRTMVVHNVGDVTNTLDALIDLPKYVTLVSSVPALADSVRPGDSAVITLRFCPQSEEIVSQDAIAISLAPCETRDTMNVSGEGYAPELDLSVMATRTFYVPDSLGGTIGDTIVIPVMVERDVNATYNGTTYWLNGLDVDVDLDHDPRSLKFIGVAAQAEPSMTVTDTPGNVRLAVRDVDTLRAGMLAELRFVVTVPEFDRTTLTVRARGFISDSLQFLDIVPHDTATVFVTTGQCNITVLRFANVGSPMMDVRPNPVTGDATITFRMQETVPVTAVISDGSGRVIRTLLDGTLTLKGGEYAVRVSTDDMPAGVYHLQLHAGVFTSTRPFIVVK